MLLEIMSTRTVFSYFFIFLNSISFLISANFDANLKGEISCKAVKVHLN
jgi:hypothetical protein